MKNSPETLQKRRTLMRKWKEITPLDSFPHKIKKRCRICGKLKFHRWNSSFTQTGKPRYRGKCEDCQKEYERELAKTEKSKESRNARRHALYLERKEIAVKVLGGKCIKCGYSKSLSGLTFHHRDASKKEFQISKMMIDKSMEEIMKEIEKCDLLCWNCHMELHGEEK
jgi:hypothetical protein